MKLSFLLPLLMLPLAPEPDALALFRQWCRSPSPELRIQAARTLRGHRGRECRVALLSLLADPHPAVRRAARGELVRRAPDEGPALVREIAGLPKVRARVEGVRVVLARKEDPSALVEDKAPEVRARALASGRVALPQVRAALKDRDARVRALALECVHDPEIARGHLRDSAEEVRIACARVVDDAASLARLLGDRSWRVQLAAVRAAERLRHAGTIAPLIRVLEGEPGRVRARAAATLADLTGADFGEDARAWSRWWALAREGFEVAPKRVRKRYRTSSAVTFRRIPVVSTRLCFVIDASRSMEKPAPGGGGRSRWELVKRDLASVLERLPRGARFNVILFRTDVEPWRKRLGPATRGARARCERWIDAAEPSGWTNLYDAVALALEDDAVDTLYMLTDGVPSRGAETKRAAILDEIAFLNRYRLVQINCVQAGGAKGLSKRWEGFLDELAKAHDGVAVRE